MRFEENYIRKVDPNYLKSNEANTTFTDGYPFLTTNIGTLEFLNKNLEEGGNQKIGMERFRPNIVVSGLEPFEEFNLEYITYINNTYRFRLYKPCQRSISTTVDQQTGIIQEKTESLKTLLNLNSLNDKHGAFFGQNSILVKMVEDEIEIGDILKKE